MEKYFEINSESHNIRCKVYYKDLHTANKAVIFGTGFAGHKDNNAAHRFADKALSKYKDLIIVVFNWPAHGDDVKKKLVLEDCDTYLRLVLEEVRTKYQIQDLYSYATSFGGYLVLKYISEHGNPFRKVALRCPAVNMYQVLTDTIINDDDYEMIMKGKDVLVGFDRKIIVTRSLLEALEDNDIRQRDFLDYAEEILILHGTLDEVVPIEDSMEFADNNLIEFIPIDRADHRFSNLVQMDLATKYILQFFDFSNE